VDTLQFTFQESEKSEEFHLFLGTGGGEKLAGCSISFPVPARDGGWAAAAGESVESGS